MDNAMSFLLVKTRKIWSLSSHTFSPAAVTLLVLSKAAEALFLVITYNQIMHNIFNTLYVIKLLHVSASQCIIIREFFCYIKVPCLLHCSSLVHTLKSVKRISVPSN
jgi:hypothetical protein